MPENNKQRVLYTFLVASLMIYFMFTYNKVLLGVPVNAEMIKFPINQYIIILPIALFFSLLFVNKSSKNIALKLVTPGKTHPAKVKAAFTLGHVIHMAPLMSLVSSIIWSDLTLKEFIAVWPIKILENAPFAFIVNFFIVTPVVGLIFKKLQPYIK
ncbi:hypothetical protein ACTL31_08020 [Leuconostoc mesenteroides]